jgi:hypothetical protein
MSIATFLRCFQTAPAWCDVTSEEVVIGMPEDSAEESDGVLVYKVLSHPFPINLPRPFLEETAAPLLIKLFSMCASCWDLSVGLEFHVKLVTVQSFHAAFWYQKA